MCGLSPQTVARSTHPCVIVGINTNYLIGKRAAVGGEIPRAFLTRATQNVIQLPDSQDFRPTTHMHWRTKGGTISIDRFPVGARPKPTATRYLAQADAQMKIKPPNQITTSTTAVRREGSLQLVLVETELFDRDLAEQRCEGSNTPKQPRKAYHTLGFRRHESWQTNPTATTGKSSRALLHAGPHHKRTHPQKRNCSNHPPTTPSAG